MAESGLQQISLDCRMSSQVPLTIKLGSCLLKNILILLGFPERLNVVVTALEMGRVKKLRSSWDRGVCVRAHKLKACYFVFFKNGKEMGVHKLGWFLSWGWLVCEGRHLDQSRKLDLEAR